MASETLRVPIDVGRGEPVVLLPGYAMRPRTYRATATLLSQHCRVIVPDIFGVRGQWSAGRVVDAFTATLDRLELDRVTLIGHSFGGGIELGFAARSPERVVELVFTDTLAVAREWVLAQEAMRHPIRLLWLATPRAAIDFTCSWLTHPRQLVEAAWWGFRSTRDDEIGRVAAAGLPVYVLWANRDSLLSVNDGRDFARDLHGSFITVHSPGTRPIDHDWMFRHPELFVEHLELVGAIPRRATG